MSVVMVVRPPQKLRNVLIWKGFICGIKEDRLWRSEARQIICSLSRHHFYITRFPARCHSVTHICEKRSKVHGQRTVGILSLYICITTITITIYVWQPLVSNIQSRPNKNFLHFLSHSWRKTLESENRKKVGTQKFVAVLMWAIPNQINECLKIYERLKPLKTSKTLKTTPNREGLQEK